MTTPTDDEAIRLCAEAMGIDALELEQRTIKYDPRTNAEQLLALVERFALTIIPPRDVGETGWSVVAQSVYSAAAINDNLALAIIHCVAKMQQAKA